MTAERFKRYLFDGGFSFGEEYVPPKWSISDKNNRNSPLGFLEFDDDHKDLCDELVDLLNEFVDEYTHLKEENEQLKTTIPQLRTDNTKQKKKLNTTMKENEQLKIALKDKENLISICEKKLKELGYLITCNDDGYTVEKI